MTKIFITIPWFLPAYRAGGPVQSVANLVKEFTEGVEYYIFCGDTDLNGAALENIKINEWVNFNDHTKVWYSGPDKISDSLVKEVTTLKPDIIYAVGIFSWHFNLVPVIFCKGPKKIISARGMLHPGALSQKKWKKEIFLRLFKLFEYEHKVVFHATDEEEKKCIQQKMGENAVVFVAGNFPNKIGLLSLPPKEPGKLKLLTIALLSPMKNISLVLDALFKIEGEIEYHIYGPVKDEEYWITCKEKIKNLPANISVQYHKEFEPAQLNSILSTAHVFILPSKSENFGHAIYEALSAGLPVITSHDTPWNQLDASLTGMNVSTENADSIATAISLFTAMDQPTFDEWHTNAAAYANGAVDVEVIRDGYKKMFR